MDILDPLLRRMEKEAARPGRVRAAPSVTAAAQALGDIKFILRGESRGKSGGYQSPNFDVFVRARLEGIRAMLSYYTDPRSLTYQKWGKSAFNAAIGMGRGNHCAHILAHLSHKYIADRKVIPLNPYGSWWTSMLADEDLAEDVRLHLQELGKYITAERLVQYLRRPDVKLKHGIDGDVGETTAHQYLHELGYHFSHAKKGQYSDGHERADVVYYRDHVYLPSIAKFQANSYIFENDGTHK